MNWKVVAILFLGLLGSLLLFFAASYLKFGTLSDGTVGIAIACWLVASAWPLFIQSLDRYRYPIALIILVLFCFGFIHGEDDCGYGTNSGTDICVRYSCAQNAHQVFCSGRRSGLVLRTVLQVACPFENFFEYGRTPEKCGG